MLHGPVPNGTKFVYGSAPYGPRLGNKSFTARHQMVNGPVQNTPRPNTKCSTAWHQMGHGPVTLHGSVVGYRWSISYVKQKVPNTYDNIPTVVFINISTKWADGNCTILLLSETTDFLLTHFLVFFILPPLYFFNLIQAHVSFFLSKQVEIMENSQPILLLSYAVSLLSRVARKFSLLSCPALVARRVFFLYFIEMLSKQQFTLVVRKEEKEAILRRNTGSHRITEFKQCEPCQYRDG